MIRLLLPALILTLLAGCNRSPTTREVENAVRDGMRQQKGVELTNFDLKRHDDGHYSGTATDNQGRQFTVTTTVPQAGRLDWKAAETVSIPMLEKRVRDEMLAQTGVEFTSIRIAQDGDGHFSGNATARDQSQYEVTIKTIDVGLDWSAVPDQAGIEKMLRKGLRDQLGADVQNMKLTRTAAGCYTGTATTSTGARFTVETYMEGRQLRWKALPDRGN